MKNKDKQNIKTRIKAVSKKMFFEKGFNAVTTNDLAYELGISKRTLYEHYQSKEQILEAIMDDVSVTMEDEFNRILNEETDYLQKMKSIFALVGTVSENFKPSFVESIRRFAPDVYPKIIRIRKQSMQSKIRIMFEKGIETGVMREDLNLDLMIPLFINAFEQIALSEELDKKMSIAEAQQLFTLMMFEGIYSKDFRRKLEV